MKELKWTLIEYTQFWTATFAILRTSALGSNLRSSLQWRIKFRTQEKTLFKYETHHEQNEGQTNLVSNVLLHPSSVTSMSEHWEKILNALIYTWVYLN